MKSFNLLSERFHASLEVLGQLQQYFYPCHFALQKLETVSKNDCIHVSLLIRHLVAKEFLLILVRIQNNTQLILLLLIHSTQLPPENILVPASCLLQMIYRTAEKLPAAVWEGGSKHVYCSNI